MDSPLKFSLKTIVFAKHMDETLWPAKIIKIIPQHKIYQVSFFNHPSIGYIEEINLLPFAPEIVKKQKRAILTKMREQKILQRTRIKIIKGIELALEEKQKIQQDQPRLCQIILEEQKAQHFMQKSRQLTLESSFQSAKKRRNTVIVCPIEKEPTKKQKLDNQIEQLCVGSHEQKAELNQQQTSRNSRHQQMYSGRNTAQAVWQSKAENVQKKEHINMLECEHMQLQKEIQECQEILMNYPVHYNQQQCNPALQLPSITAETTLANTQEDNPTITIIKQAEDVIDIHINTNESKPNAELTENKPQVREQQIQYDQNKPEAVEKPHSIQIIRQEIYVEQHKSNRIAEEMVESSKKQQQPQPDIVSNNAQTFNNAQLPIESIQLSFKEDNSIINPGNTKHKQQEYALDARQQLENNALQMKNQQNQNQHQQIRAQCDKLEVSPSHNLEIGEIVSKIVHNTDAQAIIANAGDNAEPYLKLIESPFGNEEDPNQGGLSPIPPIPLSINQIDFSPQQMIQLEQEAPALNQDAQIMRRQQQKEDIVISDSEAQIEVQLQSPQASLPQAQPMELIGSGEISFDHDKGKQAQIFIPFEEVFEDDEDLQQPNTIIPQQQQSSELQIEHIQQPQQNILLLIDESPVQKDQQVNQEARSKQTPQLQMQNAQQESVSVSIINQPDINSTYSAAEYEAIRYHLMQRHESSIAPIAEQPSEEDEEPDAEPMEVCKQEPSAFEKVEWMEIEDPLEEASIGKLSKLSVDFRVSLEEERSEGDSDGISNPVFEILQKKVNWQTQLSNIEQLYKRQFVSPHNYPSLIKTLPSLQKKMKELPEPLLAEVIKQYLSRIIAYLSAKVQDPAVLLSFVQKHIFLASITSESLSAQTVFKEDILEEFERVVELYEQGSMRKGWMSNYLAEYLMVKAKLNYFSYLCREVVIVSEEQELRLCANLAYA